MKLNPGVVIYPILALLSVWVKSVNYYNLYGSRSRRRFDARIYHPEVPSNCMWHSTKVLARFLFSCAVRHSHVEHLEVATMLLLK